jgi:hypothetical protein
MEQNHVRVIFKDGDYHLATANQSGKQVDKALFTTYLQVKELLNGLQAEIKSRVNPPVDKPMQVAKNHSIPVEPREVVKFNQDETDPSF